MSRTLTVLLLFTCVLASQTVQAEPSVNGVSSPLSIGLYQKFEVSFDITTTASNFYWPHDTAPNPGVPATVGVSVDGLFSCNNWATTIVQPAFYFQDYERNGNWLYPKGDPQWKIRFAPNTVGSWKYKIRVTDSSGTVITPEYSFGCVPSSNRGFVKVSNADCRYFETSEGSTLNLVGLSDYTTKPNEMDALYPTLGANGVNLLRVWWQGSQGPVVWGFSGQGGVAGWGGFDVSSEQSRSGELFSGNLVGNKSASIKADVKPSTTYRFSAWVKTVGVIGPVNASKPYGAWLQAFDLANDMADKPLTTPVNGNSQWTSISASVTTKAGQTEIGWAKCVLDNVSGGAAYFTDMSLQEDLGNGHYGPNIFAWPDLNVYKYISQLEAWKADYQTDLCSRNGIYLKVCLQEKQDEIFGRIQANGTAGSTNDNNVYANPTHASRTYQQYIWRYIIARYGYATSIHSFEFCNEGDPFNANHTNALQAMTDSFANQDPNKHLVTTSNWHSFPTKEMWDQISSPGYTDWHQYVGVQTSTNTNNVVYGWACSTSDIDTSVKRSGTGSLHVVGNGDECSIESRPFAITPGHTYTLSYYCKGQGLTATGTHAGSVDWIYPSFIIYTMDGWWSNELVKLITGRPGDMMGTYDWTQKSITFNAGPTAKYLRLGPSAHWAVGDLWFDDIRLHDDTAGVYVEVPNGSFDTARMDYDTSLLNLSVGTQVGNKITRTVKTPCIRGELGIVGNNVFGTPYKGFSYTGENQQLVDDQEGIWYKKLVWGQVNPYGVISMYWWRENIMAKGLYKYTKAYQTFMAAIPLSNGHYSDAKAVCSSSTMRAWGQKDTVNNKAHLWIDNTPYTWKKVVDGVAVPAASGSVTLAGLANGTYIAEWWDTTNGVVSRTETVQCSSGNIVLSVSSLQSDTACKVYPAPPDTTLPVVAITSPTSSPSYTSASASVSIAGNASDDSGITGVTWANSLGGSGACTGGASWSAAGLILHAGVNVITVTARDPAGNAGTAQLSVSYTPPDTTNPTVIITSPTSSATYSTSSDTLAIGGSASDNVGVSTVTWSNSRGGNGTCSGTTSWYASGISLLLGTNVIVVTARDSVGNSSTDTLTVTYNDATLPTIAIMSPTTLPGYSTTEDTVGVAGTAADNVEISAVTWSNSAGGSGNCSGTNSWSAAAISLVSGDNMITVTARDTSGNSITDVITVVRETIQSHQITLSIGSPTSESAFSTSADNITLGGVATSDGTITGVTWSSSRGHVGSCTGTTNWSAAAIPLDMGENIITVSASDSNGGSASDALTVTRTIAPDTSAPAVSITTPTSLDEYTVNTPSISLAGTASDDRGVTSVTWTNNRGGSGYCTGSTNWTEAAVALQTGANVITIAAHDAANNTTTDVLTVTCNASPPPTLAVTYPNDDGYSQTNARSLSLSGTATAATGMGLVSWNCSTGGSGSCSGGANWQTPAINLAVGSNAITITAQNATGQSTSVTYMINVIDTPIPSSWNGIAMVSVPLYPFVADPKESVGFVDDFWYTFCTQYNCYVDYGNDPEMVTWFGQPNHTPGRGFWACFDGNASVPVGEIPAQDQPREIHLYQGWNLIGLPFLSPLQWGKNSMYVRNSQGTLLRMSAASDVLENFAFGWRQEAGETTGNYFLVTENGGDRELQPWMAYWVKTYSECDLIFYPG